MQQQQEMPTFDVTSIPAEFNPLLNTLDNRNKVDTSGDGKLFVQFRTEPVLNPAASTKAGRPIYDDVDMIVIRTPGSQLTSVVAPAKFYMDRFGHRYRSWKAGQEAEISGTPLESFPFLLNKPGLVAELKALHVRSVEQLAEMADGHKQKIMGGFELSRKAQAFIEASKEGAQAAQLAAELEKRDSEIAALKQQMNQIINSQAKSAKKE